MTNNNLIVEERQADLGTFMVGRLLPFRKKRQVGPFTFIDHMGPAMMGDGKYMDVDQHPHIGLSTLTYLFAGEIMHRDSIGSVQLIAPGDVGFMTAGRGVTHTERTPEDRRTPDLFKLHGYQIWVALPVEREEMEPRFDYFPSSEQPRWEEDGLSFTLVAGQAFGREAPLRGYTHLFMVDVRTEKATTLQLGGKVKGEIAFVIVSGTVTIEGEEVQAGQMLISKTTEHCEIEMGDNTTLLLFGGEALPEEHYLRWNFVSHSKERLDQAEEDWTNKNFPKVPGDDTYIPIPRPKRPTHLNHDDEKNKE